MRALVFGQPPRRTALARSRGARMVPAPHDPDVASPSSQRLRRTSNRSNGRFCETGARAPENRRLAFCFAVASRTPAAASSHPHTALVLSRRMGTYGSVCESGMASFKSQRLRRTTNPSNGRLRWVIREGKKAGSRFVSRWARPSRQSSAPTQCPRPYNTCEDIPCSLRIRCGVIQLW